MRLIDADALKKKARYAFKSNTGGHIPPMVSTDDIDNAPTIEAEPVRHGWWIEHEWAEEENGLLISNFECSACHGWVRNESDYCPNCGARMDGE